MHRQWLQRTHQCILNLKQSLKSDKESWNLLLHRHQQQRTRQRILGLMKPWSLCSRRSASNFCRLTFSCAFFSRRARSFSSASALSSSLQDSWTPQCEQPCSSLWDGCRGAVPPQNHLEAECRLLKRAWTELPLPSLLQKDSFILSRSSNVRIDQHPLYPSKDETEKPC